MKSQLIVMLTHHDRTVEDAVNVFESCKDLEVQNWGFKDVGLPLEKMGDLIGRFKDEGKTTFLEVVTYTKDECLAGAKLAVDLEFDYLMGTVFYEEVWVYLKNKRIHYFPFVGKVHGSPSVLEGSTDSMIDQSEFYKYIGIEGVDLLAFRHMENPETLARDFVMKSKVPVILAGNIDCIKRIEFVNSVDPWGFTIGSALFDKRFVPKGSFRDNLIKVIEKMNSID